MEFRRQERKSKPTRLSLIWNALGSLHLARDAAIQVARSLFARCSPRVSGPLSLTLKHFENHKIALVINAHPVFN
jgi:hypothetical protein